MFGAQAGGHTVHCTGDETYLHITLQCSVSINMQYMHIPYFTKSPVNSLHSMHA